MTAFVVAALLSVAAFCGWLGCAGFLRLRDPLDRLHCVAFINVTVSLTIVAAGFVTDGLSSRSIKILLIAVLMLIGGAAGTHVTGRAVLQRRAP